MHFSTSMLPKIIFVSYHIISATDARTYRKAQCVWCVYYTHYYKGLCFQRYAQRTIAPFGFTVLTKHKTVNACRRYRAFLQFSLMFYSNNCVRFYLFISILIGSIQFSTN